MSKHSRVLHTFLLAYAIVLMAMLFLHNPYILLLGISMAVAAILALYDFLDIMEEG